MAQIILNSAKCLRCNDIIVSRHTHDFNRCSCGSLSLDGGNSYLKRSAASVDGLWEELSVMSDAPYETIRQSAYRGSYSVSGKDELHWVKLADMTDKHITATILYCKGCGQDQSVWYTNYLKEVDYRKEHNIIIGE